MSGKLPITEDQLVALGFRPRTARGWWCWLRYHSWLAHVGRVVCCVQCPRCYRVRWRWQSHTCRGALP